MDIHKIAQCLKEVTDTPLLEARLLLKHADNNLQNLIDRRLKHEPLSKIIGQKGFWKDEFITSPDVLDPRPDSETLIESVLKIFPNTREEHRILDIGVGSGCLLYSLLDEYPKATGVGMDKSEKALNIAKQNKKDRKVTLIQKDFYEANWTNDLRLFDIIVSNPPYIPTDDIKTLSPEVRQYDPFLALDGGQDGLNAYRTLSQTIPDILAPKGYLFLEIGIGQEKSVKEIFTDQGLNYIKTSYDLGGIARILIFQKD